LKIITKILTMEGEIEEMTQKRKKMMAIIMGGRKLVASLNEN
jgi:hypothetical protein